MSRYIGLDVHAQTTAIAVVGPSGKKLQHKVLETRAPVLIDVLKTIPRPRRLVLEEGTQSSWLAEVLGPHVDELVVTVPRPSRDKAKNDIADAYARAEELRRGAIDKRIFKSPATALREALRLYEPINTDVVRAKNRLRSIFRRRGVSLDVEDLYDPPVAELEKMLLQLPAAMRFSAEATLEQVQMLSELRERAADVLVHEAEKHPAYAKLMPLPAFGPKRVATVLAVVVDPHRFRKKQHFWSYCGLGIQTVVSSEYVLRRGALERDRDPMTRGLKRGNPLLKNVFKGAALSLTTRMTTSQFYAQFMKMTAPGGTRDSLARLTIARRLAATALAMWKSMEAFDPSKISR